MDLRVKNPTEKPVSVVWDGFPQDFKPGEIKVFSEGVAKHVVWESGNVLAVVTDEEVFSAPKEVVSEPVLEEPVEEPKVEEEVKVEPKPKKPRKKK